MTNLAVMPTLVMGAGGSVGKHVLVELIARGVPVRASARRPEPGRFPDGVDVFAADLTDPAGLAPAFEGVEQVFLYARHRGVRDVVRTARAAVVRRIVLMSSGSVLHPSSRGNPITEEHRAVEEAFAAAPDLTVIPVRPLVLATNSLGWAYPIRATAAVPLYQPDALIAPIHEHDVAAVAVAALTARGPGRRHRRRDRRRADRPDVSSAIRTRWVRPIWAWGAGGERRERLSTAGC